MSLRQLNLQLSYRTGRGDMVKDLFVPCLEQSVLYRRAAGYFTGFGLGLAARGVASLASRNGTMRLVALPHLEPADVEEVRQIQALSRLLGEKHGLKVRNFTFRETTEEREEILRNLAFVVEHAELLTNTRVWFAPSGLSN